MGNMGKKSGAYKEDEDYEDLFPREEGTDLVLIDHIILHPSPSNEEFKTTAQIVLERKGLSDTRDFEYLKAGMIKYCEKLKENLRPKMRAYFVRRAQKNELKLINGRPVTTYEDLENQWLENEQDENMEVLWEVVYGEQSRAKTDWADQYLATALKELGWKRDDKSRAYIKAYNDSIAGQRKGGPRKCGLQKVITFVSKDERKKIFEKGTAFHGRKFNIKRAPNQQIPGYTEEQLRKHRSVPGKFDKMMFLINLMRKDRVDYWVKYRAYHGYLLSDEEKLRWSELKADNDTVRTQQWLKWLILHPMVADLMQPKDLASSCKPRQWLFCIALKSQW